jgi:hypothetical protein
MAWPSSAGLSKANFDAGTDSPASARSELEALYDHVLLISNEVTDSATVWHSGNDGATSGLDADLLDGQHGSYYQDASNLNAGTVPLARIPTTLTGKSADQLDGQEGSYYQNASNLNSGTVPLARLSGITATELAADSVGQSEIASGAVHQGELDTGQSEVSTALSSASLTLPGGEYGFYPNVKNDNTGDRVGARIANETNALTTYASRIYLTTDNQTGTSYANQRYVNSSPPHKIEEVDYRDFIFLHMSPSGEVMSGWIANDPPWYHNGPTKVSPNIKIEKGKKHRRYKVIPDELKELKKTDRKTYIKEVSKIDYIVEEITPDIKNADMALLPHPFSASDSNIVIIEPGQSGVYRDICDLFNEGESVLELIHEGYLKVDNSEINTNGRPPGVPMHRIKWK